MRPARPLRALLFDAGNTLVAIDYAAIAAALARHGVLVTPALLERAEQAARVRLDGALAARRGPGLSAESREIVELYFRWLLDGACEVAELTAGVTRPTVVAAMLEWCRGFNQPVGLWRVRARTAAEALALARAEGLRTGVVSNSNGSVRAILGELELLEGLGCVIDSTEVGIEKPDPAIFRLGTDALAVVPGEALYIGDLYAIDVLGARAAGLDAILLDPGGHWGPRDCPTAPDALAAVRLALEGAGRA